MRFDNPIDTPVDKAIIGGRPTPGICEIVGADSPRAWDERTGYGLSGATVFFHGIRLSHFSIMLRLYTTEDWGDWYGFKDLVDRPPVGTRARSLDIVHPLLQDLGIASIVIENVLVPTQTDDGEWTIELKCIEFRQPKFALAKPQGSTATPVDPIDQQFGQDSAANADMINQLAGP